MSCYCYKCYLAVSQTGNSYRFVSSLQATNPIQSVLSELPQLIFTMCRTPVEITDTNSNYVRPLTENSTLQLTTTSISIMFYVHRV